MNKKNSISLVDILMVLVAVSWGFHPIAIKFGIENLPPSTFNPFRMVLAALSAILITAILGEFKKIELVDWPKLLFVSIIGYFCYQNFFGLGSGNTTSGNVSFIFALVPISIALINWMRGAKISTQMWFGIAISVIGVFTLILGSGQSLDLSGTNMKGIVYIFISVISFSLFTIYSSDLSKKYSCSLISCYAISITSLMLVAISWNSIDFVALKSANSVAWFGAAFSGVIAVSMASFLWTWGAEKLGSTKVSVYNNLPPVFTMVAGFFMLGERFTTIQIIGAIMIFAGLYVSNAQFGNKHSKIQSHSTNSKAA
ncbi:MAG: DMT family transporter [Tissierellales bacterium]|nr:DMT family transporter [Tissierellales bacterium]